MPTGGQVKLSAAAVNCGRGWLATEARIQTGLGSLIDGLARA